MMHCHWHLRTQIRGSRLGSLRLVLLPKFRLLPLRERVEVERLVMLAKIDIREPRLSLAAVPVHNFRLRDTASLFGRYWGPGEHDVLAWELRLTRRIPEHNNRAIVAVCYD